MFPPLPIDMSRSLETYVKAHSSSIWHFTGSAPMGTVVDNDFRVRGIDNLAICDASVLPQVTRGNPQASIMMLGRYTGMLRKQERKRKQHFGL
ncbi:unnamed protein product [Vitrella brassicaformis CCMP3155]|uniref:Glucose-methanol-choline oxidoreductase C-terminal domain-containing protein n=1 Tax=Vitrella brassicaformis (strain CCMP3155) TaxID=1169540 RepID=A0A0G4FAX0_VITBC|nr:unnamed protein product [Vitrella brassicaformis CCMP3155]|eukprot:CEM10053.1 unnamed protein product [Vitrella brassicaformis CCMP3155]